MDQQQIRDGMIRVMRKRKLILKEVAQEIPCTRATLDNFLHNRSEMTLVMNLMVEQWVKDNLNEQV